MISLPLGDSPDASGGLVRESKHGDALQMVAEGPFG
jgi:hypothetical protein